MATVATVITDLQTALATAQSLSAPPVAPTITSFAVVPATLPVCGGSVTLSATIGGSPAPTLTLDGVALPSLPVTLPVTANHTFALGATNSAGSATASALVTVATATTSRFADLPANTARNLGPYANPDPQFSTNGLRAASIVDDSGLCAEIIGDKVYLRGGGHGPSQETTIRVFDLVTLTWSNVHAPTNVADMTVANIDLNFGRYISTNHPTARHTYQLIFRVDTGGHRYLYCLTGRGQPDYLPGVTSGTYWGGRMFWYDLDSGQYAFSAIKTGDFTGGVEDHRGGQAWSNAGAGVLDPVTGKVLIVSNDRQDGAANFWLVTLGGSDVVVQKGPSVATAGAPGASIEAHSMAYWPENDKFYIVANDYGGSAQTPLPYKLYEVTLNRANFAASTCILVPCTGPVPTWKWSKNSNSRRNNWSKKFGGMILDGTHYELDPVTRVWSTSVVTVEPNPDNPTGVNICSESHCVAFDDASGCFVFLWNSDKDGNNLTKPRTWVYRPPGNAVNPSLPSPSKQSNVDDLAITLDFGGGKVAAFAGKGAADMGDFVGEFVRQKSYLCMSAAFPDWRIWFRVDADATGARIVAPAAGWRDEIVVEYGRATVGTPVDVGPYTATVSKVGKTLATYAIAKHWWYSRWRHQSSMRPVVRTPATLIARKWIPNFATDGMFGQGSYGADVAWPGPLTQPNPGMFTGGFTPATAAGGDHDELGHLTESAASYAIFGAANNLRTLRTEGEWTGNFPMHIRAADGSMLMCRDLTSAVSNEGGALNATPHSRYDAGPANPGFVGIDGGAHWYANANAPWLLTDDPFMLEALQFGINRRILYDLGPRQLQKLPGLIYPGETRCYAWGLRDLFLAAASTPTSVPMWLQPRSYFKACLDDNLAFSMQFVNAPARIHSMFREWTHTNICSSWQGAWLSTQVGIGVQMGFSEWTPVFNWSIGKQIAMTNGTSGWNRQWPMPYYSIPNKNTAAYSDYTQYPQPISSDATAPINWADCWAYYKHGSDGHSDTDASSYPQFWPINDAGWDGKTLIPDLTSYPPHGYLSFYLHLDAALALAKTMLVAGADACYSWYHAALAAKLPKFPGVQTQARFSFKP